MFDWDDVINACLSALGPLNSFHQAEMRYECWVKSNMYYRLDLPALIAFFAASTNCWTIAEISTVSNALGTGNGNTSCFSSLHKVFSAEGASAEGATGIFRSGWYSAIDLYLDRLADLADMTLNCVVQSCTASHCILQKACEDRQCCEFSVSSWDAVCAQNCRSLFHRVTRKLQFWITLAWMMAIWEKGTFERCTPCMPQLCKECCTFPLHLLYTLQSRRNLTCWLHGCHCMATWNIYDTELLCI